MQKRGAVFCLITMVTLGIDGADQKRDREHKVIGALLNTPHTVLPQELRTSIASFAAPRSTSNLPIDFLLKSVIVPKEYGVVCDIHRDPLTKKLKILTCRYGAPRDEMLRKVRSFALGSAAASLGYLALQWVSGCNMMPFEHEMSLQRSLGVGLITVASYVKDVIDYNLDRASLAHPKHEALIINGATMCIEARFEACQFSWSSPKNLYFLNNAHTVVVRDTLDGFRYFTKDTVSGKFRETTVVLDDASTAEHTSREREYWHEHEEEAKMAIASWSGIEGAPDNIYSSELIRQKILAFAQWSTRVIMPSLIGPREHVGMLEDYEEMMFSFLRLAECYRLYRQYNPTVTDIQQLFGHNAGLEISDRDCDIALHYIRTYVDVSTQLEISDRSGHVALHQFMFEANLTKKIVSALALPSYCNRSNTYALRKTSDSSCAVLKIEGRTVLVDFMKTVSPELQILLKNHLDFHIPLEIHSHKKPGYSFMLLPYRARQRIAENVQVFLGNTRRAQ